jgi:hypothetical protein
MTGLILIELVFESLETLISQSYENPIAIESNLVAGGVFGCGHAHDLPISNIELGSMPRTNQAKSFEFAVAQGPSVMGAQILNAVDLVVETNQNYKSIEHFHGLGLSGVQLRELAHILKVVVVGDDRNLSGLARYSYCLTCRAMAAPNASRTDSMVIRSKIC